MRDLTEGSVSRHILTMAGPIAVGLVVQTTYHLVDLYFVGRIGPTALAGVGAAANAMFLVFAFIQILSVGSTALISHAAGRKDRADANLLFNQSVSLAALFGLTTLILTYGLAGAYTSGISANAAAMHAGRTYLYWIGPGMALQFAVAAMGSALRGVGVVRPTMMVQLISVASNIVLAPILIAGWGTGHPLGVAGAGLATSISVGIAVIVLSIYFYRLEHFVGFEARLIPPRLSVWKRMLAIGLPSGGEFFLLFIYMAVIYWVIRDFGAAAQAGFGVGYRVMQSIFLPAMAITFAAPAIGGQNFGANHSARVRETFRATLLITGAIMIGLTVLCQIRPAILVRPFTNDPEAMAVAAGFLRIISWNFVASGVILTGSAMFQAIGNTWPSLLATATRLVTFVAPAAWLSQQPHFTLNDVWYLSVATVAAQAVFSYLLVQWQFRRRLPAPLTAGDAATL